MNSNINFFNDGFEVVIDEIFKFLNSDVTVKNYSIGRGAFSRQEKSNTQFNFLNTVIAIMARTSQSATKVIDDLFKDASINSQVTQQAFNLAKQKVDPELFLELISISLLFGKIIRNRAYRRRAKRLGNKFPNMLCLAVDSTTIKISSHPSAVKFFGGQKYGKGEEIIPMLRVSLLYDIVTGIIVDVIVSPYLTDERTLLTKHLENIKIFNFNPKMVMIIGDRGYPSHKIVRLIQSYHYNYLFRVKSNYNKIVRTACDPDQVILDPSNGEQRVLNIPLSSGINEKLITNFFNKDADTKYFKWLYFERWDIEVRIRYIKHLFGEEGLRFYKKETKNTIELITLATCFLNNLVAIEEVIKDEQIAHQEQLDKLQECFDRRRFSKRDNNEEVKYRVNIKALFEGTKFELMSSLTKGDPSIIIKKIESFGSGSKLKTYVYDDRQFPRFTYNTIKVPKGKSK